MKTRASLKYSASYWRLIRICWIWWQCTFVLLWTENTILVHIWSAKVLIWDETLCLVPFKYVVLNSDFHLLCVGPGISIFANFDSKNQNYLLNFVTRLIPRLWSLNLLFWTGITLSLGKFSPKWQGSLIKLKLRA